jgi:pimeloyl-ACP methyl ester carboxylesterase
LGAFLLELRPRRFHDAQVADLDREEKDPTDGGHAMKRTVQLVLVVAAASVALLGCKQQPAGHSQQSAPAGQGSAAVVASPIPATTGYADVKGTRHYYQVTGDLKSGKMPLLVLHGSMMSADAMAPLVERFAKTRPVIALDARGHGRTLDIAGPITYELLADDAASVLAALDVKTADVLGYSMGGITAIVMAIRHSERVNKLIPVSAPYSRQGWYPEVQKAFEQWSPDMLAGSGLEAEYKRLSATPDALPALIAKLMVLEKAPYAWPEAHIRELDDRTMVVVGDADGVQLDHAIKLFVLRGGGDREAAVKGFLAEAPRARLAVLPGTSHIGMLARSQLIVDVVTPFLDDEKPPLPDNFLQPGPGKTPAETPEKQ